MSPTNLNMALPLLTCALLTFTPMLSWGSNKNFTKNFLKIVAMNSPAFAISKLEEQSSVLNFETPLGQFDTTGYLGTDITDSKDPITSPFSTSSTKRKVYSAGFGKLWDTGLETSLDYTVSDTALTFPGRDNVQFMSPDLSLTLKTSLLRDLYGGSLRATFGEVEAEKSALSNQAKMERKAILVEALLTLSNILEAKEELKLQQSLCLQIRRQADKLKSKYARRSISKRDYLLSQKDLNTCSSSIKTVQNRLLETSKILRTQFYIKDSVSHSGDIKTFFAELETIYKSKNQLNAPPDLESREDLVVLKMQSKAAKLKNQRLAAETYPDIQLQLTAGYRGLGDRFPPAQEDIYESQYPYILGSVRIEFPFSNREAKSQLEANRFQTLILEKKLAQREFLLKENFVFLKRKIYQNFSVYEDLRKNVGLSKLVLEEAQRDFNNGQLDLFNLSEYQKAVIQSQQKLAGLRTALIVGTVEYLDYFHFFDRYF